MSVFDVDADPDHFPCQKCGATYENGYNTSCALCLMNKDVAENRDAYDAMGDV